MQAFSVYEDSISESRAQLQAITLIIGTLQGAKVFSEDNYDTLITKAALHGARLLKKPHQATAVNLASHLWWQEVASEDESAVPAATPKETEKVVTTEDGAESPKAVSILLCYMPVRMLSESSSTVSSPGQQACAGVPAEGAPYRKLCRRRYCDHTALLRHAGQVSLLP